MDGAMTIEHLRGIFITVEGLDGSGLTTQADLLRGALEDEGRETFLTKEPSEGPAGSLIRLALAKRLGLDEETMALLFAADRTDHLHTEILPRLRSGFVVICDRYYLSTYAYQAIDLEIDWLKAINSRAMRPDLTIFLDVPPEVCERRMKKQRWHVELYEEVSVLTEVRANYLRAVKELQMRGESIEVVDGNVPIRDVHKAIQKVVRRYLGPRVRQTSGASTLWDENPPLQEGTSSG